MTEESLNLKMDQQKLPKLNKQEKRLEDKNEHSLQDPLDLFRFRPKSKISIIMLNVNGLNTSIRRKIMRMDFKKKTHCMSSTRNPLNTMIYIG